MAKQQHHVTALNDKQVAHVVIRGTGIILSLMQEETVDIESGFILAAKSFTVDQIEGLQNLRDLLNKVMPPEGSGSA